MLSRLDVGIYVAAAVTRQTLSTRPAFSAKAFARSPQAKMFSGASVPNLVLVDPGGWKPVH